MNYPVAYIDTQLCLLLLNPLPTPPGKAWQRKILADLEEATHFSATELQVGGWVWGGDAGGRGGGQGMQLQVGERAGVLGWGEGGWPRKGEMSDM